MVKDLDIVVTPEIAYDPLVLKQFVSQHTRIKLQEINEVVVHKRSVDARSKYVKINPSDIKVNLERQDNLEVLEVKIELPDAR